MLSEVVRLVWSAGGAVVSVFTEKSKAEEVYRYVVPQAPEGSYRWNLNE